MAYFLEILVFLGSIAGTGLFCWNWYSRLFSAWPPEYYKTAKPVLGALPAVSLVIILVTLRMLASFDVVDNGFYIFFYVLLGFSWIWFGMFLTFICFDLSWRDDAIYLRNKAALAPVAGAFLGVTLIYAGANIGDGPGWWCVVFAGGLGLAAWLGLGILADRYTGVFERVTVDRDLSSGIRFGCYLIASGIILARASGGDWTSFGRTVVEFLDGWPVLLLTALFVVVERMFIAKTAEGYLPEEESPSRAIILGLLYIVVAGLCVMLLPPFAKNPVYTGLANALVMGG